VQGFLPILPRDLDDASLWRLCQRDEWVLFTDNRNLESNDSLESVIRSEWITGCLPVVNIANKSKFSHDREYRTSVAAQIADLMFDLAQGKKRDQPRIYVPW
jgi:hypothetical protein